MTELDIRSNKWRVRWGERVKEREIPIVLYCRVRTFQSLMFLLLMESACTAGTALSTSRSWLLEDTTTTHTMPSTFAIFTKYAMSGGGERRRRRGRGEGRGGEGGGEGRGGEGGGLRRGESKRRRGRGDRRGRGKMRTREEEEKKERWVGKAGSRNDENIRGWGSILSK
jgi:hypothetical protein